MATTTSLQVGLSLDAFLQRSTKLGAQQTAVNDVVQSLATAAIAIAAQTRQGPLAGALGADTGANNSDGDNQKELDVLANKEILNALSRTATRYYASEEEDTIQTLNQQGRLAVAVDPLDGSSNIDVNVSIGTIFSVYPASEDGANPSFFRPCYEQIAAGYFIYGPHTALVLTLGAGTHLFVLNPNDNAFHLAVENITIPSTTSEFAINSSNYRHWHEPVKTFIDDCLAGSEGPRGKDFNMRWVASLVAETHRIFSRGGVFLYPSDQRGGYQSGRLRLLYEAAPIAFLVENANGRAIDGNARILDRIPTDLHQRTPLFFGSAEKISRIHAYHTNETFNREHSPLFRSRGLFSA